MIERINSAIGKLGRVEVSNPDELGGIKIAMDLLCELGRRVEMEDERDGLRKKVAELEAKQTPRPMSEAPRDLTFFLVFTYMWEVASMGTDGVCRDVGTGGIFGDPHCWLPCPPNPKVKG